MESLVTVTSESDTPLSRVKRGVPAAFDRVAHAYDRLTGLNPGYHRHLTRSAERLLLSGDRPRILDLCCGTGSSTAALLQVYPRAAVVGLDASGEMLRRAETKTQLASVDFVEGDASDPAAAGVTGPFDGVLMAYGIRNVPEPDRALRRIHSLLAPGGRAVFHEYSVADSWLRRAVFETVCFSVMMPSALLASGTIDLFRYLRRSVVSFDGVQGFSDRLRRAGFVDVWTAEMDGWQRGIVHSFVARRPR